MQRANDALLNYDPVIKKAIVNLADEDQTVIIASSDGRLVRDNRQRTRLRMQAVAMDGDRMQNSAKARARMPVMNSMIRSTSKRWRGTLPHGQGDAERRRMPERRNDRRDRQGFWRRHLP